MIVKPFITVLHLCDDELLHLESFIVCSQKIIAQIGIQILFIFLMKNIYEKIIMIGP